MAALAQPLPWAYQPLPSPRRFHADIRNRYKGFSGPVGSGKSRALCYEALFLANMNPGLPGLLGAPTYPMLRDVTRKTLLEVLQLEEIDYTANLSENRIVLKGTGSEILLRSLSDPDRLRGTNLAWFGVDELTYCQEAAFQQLEARLRHPKALRHCGFAVWTPNGFDWVYKRFLEERRTGHFIVMGTPRENFHVGGDFYDSLERSYDPRFYEQEVLGKYLNLTSGQVYYGFSREDTLRNLDWDPTASLCWALDFNVDPMCSVIAQVIDATTRTDMMNGRDRKEIHVIDEVSLRSATIEQACNEFVRKIEKYRFPQRMSTVVLYGDASGKSRTHAGPSAWQTVKECLARVPGIQLHDKTRMSNPPVKDRVAAVNSALCNAAQERRLFVHPRCQELQRDLEQVIWKVDSAGAMIPELDKQNKMRTHISDALGYLVEVEMPMAHRSGGMRSAGFM